MSICLTSDEGGAGGRDRAAYSVILAEAGIQAEPEDVRTARLDSRLRGNDRVGERE